MARGTLPQNRSDEVTLNMESKPMRTDEELMAAVAARDHDAFNELYERHRHGLKGLITKNFREQKTQVEDLLQRGWLRVWKYADSYNGSTKVFTWLMNIFRMEIARQLHKEASQDTIEEAHARLVMENNPLLKGEDYTPLEAIVHQEDIDMGMATIQAAAMLVGPRAVKIMDAIMGGRDYADIAQQFKIHKSRVGQIVNQVRHRTKRFNSQKMSAVA